MFGAGARVDAKKAFDGQERSLDGLVLGLGLGLKELKA